MAGGEIAGMRNANTMTVQRRTRTCSVFDRIEAGKFQSVDFIEAYICPDGCIGGQLTIEGRYEAAKRCIRVLEHIAERAAGSVRSRRRRSAPSCASTSSTSRRRSGPGPSRRAPQDLRQAIAIRQEKERLLDRLPRKDCAACGAPGLRDAGRGHLRGEADDERLRVPAARASWRRH